VCEEALRIGSHALWGRCQPFWQAAALAETAVMTASGTIELTATLVSLVLVVLPTAKLCGMWLEPVRCGQELHLPVAFAASVDSVAAALSAPLAAAPADRAQAMRAW